MTLQNAIVPAGGGPLTARRKAAMVVQMMIAGGRRLPLDQLSEQAQLKLTQELAALRIVDKDTVDQVAGEFSIALESIGISAPGSVEAALQALEGQISDDAMLRLKSEVGRGPIKDPWARVTKLEKEDLLRIVETEAPEISAVLLSKLPAGPAAEVLNALPGQTARRIALAVSHTAEVAPSTVHDIGNALVEDYINDDLSAFAVAPAPRVGAILNVSAADVREGLLEGLEQDDPEFAEEVRRNIFTFVDIPDRIEPTDLPKVLRLVDNEDLVTAMAAASSLGEEGIKARSFIIANLSKRMAAALEEEMEEKGKVKAKVGEAAMTILITAIRDSADRGDIKLIEPETDEDD